jgi:translocation and assembly module TamB
MRRLLKTSAIAAAAVLLLVAALGGAVLLAGNTDWGRAQIEHLTYHLTGGYVTLTGLAGSLPLRPTLRRLELRDAGGVWLSADGLAVQWSPLALLERRIQVDRLQAARVHMERTPVSDSHGGSVSIPHIEVGSFSIDAVELGAPLVGTPASLSAHGTVELRSLEDANADVVARRLDGEGAYVAHLRFDRKRMEASLSVHEPSGGPLEHLLAVPGLGALSATMTLQGPRSAERIEAEVRAGDLHGQVNGSIDVVHETADLTYSLTAPAMSLRPDVSWTHVALHGTWRGSLSAPAADGHLDVDGLRLADTTQIRQLQATLAGSAGKLALQGLVYGLELPGPQPRIFAADPLRFDASLQLNAASRPLELTVLHPLFKLHAHAATLSTNTAPLRAAVELTLPEVAPFAAYAAQDVRGKALINAQAEFGHGIGALKLDADVGLTGGTALWIAAVGPRLRLQLSGSLSNDAITLQSLHMDGRAMTLAASGRAVRTDGTSSAAGFVKTLQSRWQLDISDLGALSSDLAGNLKASGRLSGSLASMAGDAELSSRLSVRGSPAGVVEASVQVHGLPKAPGGALQAHGMVDGAPLNVDAAVDRSGREEFRLLVRHADWKSAHIEGDLSTDAGMTRSHGQLRLQVGQLGDFDRLLGMSVAGSVEGTIGIVPAGEHTQAHLELDGKDLVAGQFAGTVQLQGSGVFDNFVLALTAQLPKFHGHPARVQSAATLNLDSRALRVSNLSVGYRGETFRLLLPAQITFQKELSVDELKVGARDAVLDIKGELAPTLDLRASLEKLNPGLVNAFSPGLLASGTIEARARLEGTLANPNGTLRLDATGVQFADESATGLPAADLHARAQLAGDTAAVTVKLTGGSSSQLTLSGTAPLDAGGALDLKIGGKLDVGLASPLLEARGLRATGQLTVDATVTGTAAAPQVGGGITLAGGSVRDYARGVNISDINAVVVGSEGALQIKSFTAKAAQGTVSVSGSFGVLQPGMPIDLRIHAKNAQPIASNIVTANLDSDLHVSGSARQRIDVSGTIHVNRATIGIPDSLPPDVAVLDVRRRGQGAPAAVETQLVIGLDVTVQAPQQILVQGRGLDAELGGDIHISGTTDNPVATGRFDLQRGTFTIAGSRLDFTPPGGVSFDGAGLTKKIDPTLDFTATTVLPTSTATLHISGPADAPRFDFSSTTQQSPDEIMAQLLFGENASQLSALQAAQIGWALASLTGVGGSGLNPLVKLQKTLGLDRLTVGTNTTTTATGATENSGAAIAAGRYISKRVYIEGRQTNTGTSQVQVDVDLTKHLKLQTRLGNGTASTQGTTPENDPGSSVGLSYQFEY